VRAGKTGLERLGQYAQRATFADGQLVVTSGFEYAAGAPLRKTGGHATVERSGSLAGGRP
jgi:hypothetical protein